jgi:hypothetical protein
MTDDFPTAIRHLTYVAPCILVLASDEIGHDTDATDQTVLFEDGKGVDIGRKTSIVKPERDQNRLHSFLPAHGLADCR